MDKCLYCGTPFYESDKHSCARCGAPLPFVITQDGEPKFEAMQSIADLMYRMPPPTFRTTIYRHSISMKVDRTDADVRFKLPNSGFLSWLGVTAEDKRVVQLRLIVNGNVNIFDLIPLPLPLSLDIGLLDLAKILDASLEIYPAKTALPTTYTIHYNRLF